jgi:hypothetical protein
VVPEQQREVGVGCRRDRVGRAWHGYVVNDELAHVRIVEGDRDAEAAQPASHGDRG